METLGVIRSRLSFLSEESAWSLQREHVDEVMDDGQLPSMLSSSEQHSPSQLWAAVEQQLDTPEEVDNCWQLSFLAGNTSAPLITQWDKFGFGNKSLSLSTYVHSSSIL